MIIIKIADFSLFFYKNFKLNDWFIVKNEFLWIILGIFLSYSIDNKKLNYYKLKKYKLI